MKEEASKIALNRGQSSADQLMVKLIADSKQRYKPKARDSKR